MQTTITQKRPLESFTDCTAKPQPTFVDVFQATCVKWPLNLIEKIFKKYVSFYKLYNKKKFYLTITPPSVDNPVAKLYDLISEYQASTASLPCSLYPSWSNY